MPRTVQVVLYKEGEGYVAQCLDVDLMAGGRSETDARDTITEALELYFEEPASELHYTPITEARVEQITVATPRLPAPLRPASGGPCPQ
jgi:predicted RNase H-like HicB family nuclease